MPASDPILNALAQMEERFVEQLNELGRSLRLEVKAGFDPILKRLDRFIAQMERDRLDREDLRRLPPE